jgi:hypothetical protein
VIAFKGVIKIRGIEAQKKCILNSPPEVNVDKNKIRAAMLINICLLHLNNTYIFICLIRQITNNKNNINPMIPVDIKTSKIIL